MVKSARRSTLQLELLMQLRERPGSSISALVDSVTSSRPAVSRSLHTLLNQDLVRKEGRKWSLSAAGEAEASTAARRLHDDAQEIIEVAGKKYRAITRAGETLSMLPKFQEILNMSEMNPLGIGSISEVASMSLQQTLGLMESSSLSHTIGSMAGLGDCASTASSLAQQISSMSLDDSLMESAHQSMGAICENIAVVPSDSWLDSMGLATELADVVPGQLLGSSALATVGNLSWFDTTLAASPILTAQDAFASFLSALPATEQLVSYGLIAEQTSLLSTALDNVLTLGRFPTAAQLISESVGADYAQIPNHLLSISDSLSAVFQDQLHIAHVAAWDRSPKDVAELLLHSTAPVTSYSSAVRYLTESEAQPATQPYADHEPMGNEGLDPLLSRLDPDFVGKRRGSWIALNGTNPDRLAHAAGSQKNLLLQVLRLLVSDSEISYVDLNEKGSKIKARVKQIMGGSESETDHVMAVANAVVTGYAIYNKYDHTNQKNEQALRAHLQTGEALLFMVLIRLNG